MRVRDQVTHFTLLNQLHLPYLLCPNTVKKENSRNSCVYASREILTRFITFRTFNGIATCCRLADFFALVAGMALIIAHLESHSHKETDNLLTHQRLGDRATVEQALETMDMNPKLNEGMLVTKCARVLRLLLHIEADAARRQSHSMDKAQGAESNDDDEGNALFITHPFFGTIRVAHDGIKFVDELMASSQPTQDLGADITIGGIGSVHVVDHMAPSMVASDSSLSSAHVPAGLGDCVNLSPHFSSYAVQPQPQPEDVHTSTFSDSAQLTGAIAANDFMMQQDLYPALAAGTNDWMFPVMDTASFDSLMMEMNVPVGDRAGAAGEAHTVHGHLGGS
jgi:hypothetical protein